MDIFHTGADFLYSVVQNGFQHGLFRLEDIETGGADRAGFFSFYHAPVGLGGSAVYNQLFHGWFVG